MTNQEIDIFIDEMKTIGDNWNEDDVRRVYGDKSLDEAIADRKRDLDQFFGNFNTFFNR